MTALLQDSLQIDGLVVGRGGFRVGPFTFNLAAGALVAVIGPNGGGKTTLLKTLANLLPPLAGAVRGSDTLRCPAYLPPPGTIAAPFPAAHLVALGRASANRLSPTLGSAARAAAQAAMDGIGIADLAARSFDRLSSGQQQLVLIARLYAQDAALCLLDEPTAMLDPAQVEKIERALMRLARSGRMVVASTHRLALAARADLVIAVGGRVAVGPPSDVLKPGLLSDLYGTALSPCPCCGQVAVV